MALLPADVRYAALKIPRLHFDSAERRRGLELEVAPIFAARHRPQGSDGDGADSDHDALLPTSVRRTPSLQYG